MPDKDASNLTLDEAMAGLPSEFEFFRERWRQDVQPDLAFREDARIAAAQRARTFRLYAIGAGLALGAGAFALMHHPAAVIVGVIAAAGLWWFGYRDLNAMRDEAKLMLVDPVAREFGMDFTHRIGAPEVISQFRMMGMVPDWDRASFEDRLTGTRKDAPFEFFEAKLEKRVRTSDGKGRTRTHWKTVFQGQCLVVHFPKPFEGSTRVYRDAGMLNGLVRLGHAFGQHERVGLEDPKFEKAFEVYSTDQIEARYLLTPDFMERLLNLEATFHGKKLRCAFSGGEMFVAVEGGNLFEAGSMFRPMDDLGRVREILEDFAAVFLLIDAMGQRYTPDALKGPSA